MISTPPSLDKIPKDVERVGKPRIQIGKEQLDFGEFVKLLGALQRQGKISGAEYRPKIGSYGESTLKIEKQ